MNKKKLIQIFSVLMTNIYTINAVQIVQSSSPPNETSGQGLAITFLVILFISVLGFALFLFFVFLLVKLWNKLTEYNRKKKDFIYYMFEDDDKQCHSNHDSEMKKRNWKLLWLFWKRNPVYINTKEGFKLIGTYHGESDKKENFYLISIYNKMGLFKMFTRIILIPNTIKHIVKKVYINGVKILIIDAHNIDRIVNTDYFYIPLIEDPYNNEKYLDFADMVYEQYIEKSVYRDLIKENLQQYREGVIKAVETNVNVQVNRRKQ